MSQDFLLKTPVAPAAPKLENTRVANQSNKPENTDKPSFSSALDQHVGQNEALRKEPEEKIEMAANHPDEQIKENRDEDESGNVFPENAVEDEDSSEISQELASNLINEALDVSVVTKVINEALEPKLVSVGPLVTEKMVIADEKRLQLLSKEALPLSKKELIMSLSGKDKLQVQSLNKESSNSIIGVNAASISKSDHADGLELNTKQLTTNLRSDIFHALSKNKSSEAVMLDDSGKKTLLNKVTDRSPAGFSIAPTSAATLNTASIQSNSASPPILAVQPAIQSSAWNQVLSSRVVWMAREGIQEASLKLNPANLGSVEVKLNMHNDQANVLFIAQNAATRDALEQALPKLRESFEENGMQLADADVAEQEFGKEEEANSDSGDQKHNNRQHSQQDGESDSQPVIIENDVEVGLSLYA